MKIFRYLLISCFIILNTIPTSNCTLYYLHDTMNMIDRLIAQDQISAVLEDGQEYDVQLLTKNYSPALIALEIEVLNHPTPTVVYFYRGSNAEHADLLSLITHYAEQYDESIKFVAVDIEQVPSMVVHFELSTVPAISAIKERHEITFIDEAITDRVLQDLMNALIK